MNYAINYLFYKKLGKLGTHLSTKKLNMNYFQTYFLDIITKKYADFSGRARRSEYWYFQLFNILFLMGVSLLTSLLGNSMAMIGSIIIFVYALGIIIPSIAIVVRRLHDIGKSGWWYFIGIIPLIGTIIILIYLCTDSQSGRNEYGPNPKEESDELTDFLISD